MEHTIKFRGKGLIHNQWIYGGFPIHAFTETSEEGFQCEIVRNFAAKHVKTDINQN